MFYYLTESSFLPGKINFDAGDSLKDNVSIPQIWYERITVNPGKPDILAINILFELVNLHKFHNRKGSVLSYTYLRHKFHCTEEQIVEILKLLAKKQLITIKTAPNENDDNFIEVGGQFLLLNVPNLLRLR